MKIDDICEQEYNKMMDYRERQGYKGYFFKSNRQMFNMLIPDGSTVLDYGCGKGTLGDRKNIYVEFLDKDANNHIARYHAKEEVSRSFDYIIFSHVMEHMRLEEIDEVLAWARDHAGRIIVSMPNTSNIFTNFYSDLSHVRPYDNMDFVYFVERHGFKPEGVFKNDIMIDLNKLLALNRLLFCILTSCSPYYNFTFVSKRSQARDV